MQRAQVRCLSLTYGRQKQLPKLGSETSGWHHPKKYLIRRSKPHTHRPNYQRNEQEVLWDQILQPHYPTAYKYPGSIPQHNNK